MPNQTTMLRGDFTTGRFDVYAASNLHGAEWNFKYEVNKQRFSTSHFNNNFIEAVYHTLETSVLDTNINSQEHFM